MFTHEAHQGGAQPSQTSDRQIDQLKSELYGLTEEEIRVVEESIDERCKRT
jgi:hypothetical protein